MSNRYHPGMESTTGWNDERLYYWPDDDDDYETAAERR